MKYETEQVARFMRTFGQATPFEIGMPESSIRELRDRLHAEEFTETQNAKTPVEMIDGVIDLIYVALGTAVACGFNGTEVSRAFDIIHNSNMSKLWTAEEVQAARAADPTIQIDVKEAPGITLSKRFVVRRLDGKVLKSPSYIPANLSRLIA